jgi:hypothetical protein
LIPAGRNTIGALDGRVAIDRRSEDVEVDVEGRRRVARVAVDVNNARRRSVPAQSTPNLITATKPQPRDAVRLERDAR